MCLSVLTFICKNELQRTYNGVSNQDASRCQHRYSLTFTMMSTRLSELVAYLISSLITVHVNSHADTVSYFYHGVDPVFVCVSRFFTMDCLVYKQDSCREEISFRSFVRLTTT